jgi:membrane peptidoglycan carboxypeptidase
VVYVGFDDNDDLAMKGSDSAMPIWADFMQEALRRNPEWNGDWAMPGGVRKAEIDVRNGSLIRELELAETLEPKSSPSPTPKPSSSNSEDPAWATEFHDSEVRPEVFVTIVPAEFRRIELFISGTVPARAIINTDEGGIQYDPETGEPIVPRPSPQQSPTPVEQTWEDSMPSLPDPEYTPDRATPRPGPVTVIICPESGLRATVNCPTTEARAFNKGREPRDHCAIHR